TVTDIRLKAPQPTVTVPSAGTLTTVTYPPPSIAQRTYLDLPVDGTSADPFTCTPSPPSSTTPPDWGSMSCTPASGSGFAVGTPAVPRAATAPPEPAMAGAGTILHGPIPVVVTDSTPPVLSLPADLVVEATSPFGAAVTFTATATDDSDGPVAVTCT